MKLIQWQESNTKDRHYHLILTDADLITTHFDKWDYALIDEVGNLSNPPICDILLVLEMICRRIKEQKNNEKLRPIKTD